MLTRVVTLVTAVFLLSCSLFVTRAFGQPSCGAVTVTLAGYYVPASNHGPVQGYAETARELVACPVTSEVEAWVDGLAGGAVTNTGAYVANVTFVRHAYQDGTYIARSKHWTIWYGYEWVYMGTRSGPVEVTWDMRTPKRHVPPTSGTGTVPGVSRIIAPSSSIQRARGFISRRSKMGFGSISTETDGRSKLRGRHPTRTSRSSCTIEMETASSTTGRSSSGTLRRLTRTREHRRRQMVLRH